jgi:1-acyl-sn-glycerol-3-phosphate acyltransferase
MPVVGFLMRNFGSFPLRQEIRDPVAVRTMIALYRAGKAIMIFPEGMRSKDGELLPFFPDFARLMIKMRARMVPAAIAGGSEVLPIGSRIIRPRCPVTVVYGEPFDLAPYFGRPLTDELLREAAEYARSRVAASLEVAREERRKLAVKS